ncbi:MAG: PAS domain-containing protein [Firmicutes bacterium]|nr:PAS domain-containing protein [Bacillota bacterium]
MNRVKWGPSGDYHCPVVRLPLLGSTQRLIWSWPAWLRKHGQQARTFLRALLQPYGDDPAMAGIWDSSLCLREAERTNALTGWLHVEGEHLPPYCTYRGRCAVFQALSTGKASHVSAGTVQPAQPGRSAVGGRIGHVPHGVELECLAVPISGPDRRCAGVLQLLLPGRETALDAMSHLNLVSLALSQLLEEAQSNEQSQRLWLLLSPIAAIAVDQRNRITLINAQAEHLWNCVQEEWLGRPVEDLVRLVAAGGRDALTLVRQTGQPYLGELWAEASTGRGVRTYLASVVPTDVGGPMGLAVYLVDTTEEMTLRRQLRHLERLRTVGDLAALTAHDLRNHLTSMRAQAQLGWLVPEARRDGKIFRDIVREVDEVTWFLEQFLNLSRPDQPQPGIQAQPLDVMGLIHDLIRLVEARLRKAGVECEVSTPAGPPPLVLADGRLLRQAFLNIIVNAIDAMRDGGRLQITVAAAEDSSMVRLGFHDSGTGIPAGVLEHVFEPFFSTKGSEGVGLGLFVARQIVEDLHHGRIWAESKPGAGTTFWVEIPKAADGERGG